jgi:hypothetical protein
MPGYSGTHVERARGTDCEAGQPVINVVIYCHLLLYSTTRYSKLWFPVDSGTATWISARVAGDSSLQYGEQTVRYGRRAAAGEGRPGDTNVLVRCRWPGRCRRHPAASISALPGPVLLHQRRPPVRPCCSWLQSLSAPMYSNQHVDAAAAVNGFNPWSRSRRAAVESNLII